MTNLTDVIAWKTRNKAFMRRQKMIIFFFIKYIYFFIPLIIHFFSLWFLRVLHRYNNLNVEQILSSDRLVTNYVECLLSRKPCPPEGKDLKREYSWCYMHRYKSIGFCKNVVDWQVDWFWWKINLSSFFFCSFAYHEEQLSNNHILTIKRRLLNNKLEK